MIKLVQPTDVDKEAIDSFCNLISNDIVMFTLERFGHVSGSTILASIIAGLGISMADFISGAPIPKEWRDECIDECIKTVRKRYEANELQSARRSSKS